MPDRDSCHLSSFCDMAQRYCDAQKWVCCSPGREIRPVLGVIGCMAERLKGRLFDEKAVDIIAGPDALRSVPGLIELFSQVAPLGERLAYMGALLHAAPGLM